MNDKEKKAKRSVNYFTTKKYNERIRLKSGTFLHVYCPNCEASLIESNQVRFIAVREDDSEGYLELSPYLNVFEHHSTIDIQPKTELKDLKCPHCNTSLVDPSVRCDLCNSRTARLLIAAVHIRVPFLICLKEGCKWHGLRKEDEQTLIMDACDEW